MQNNACLYRCDFICKDVFQDYFEQKVRDLMSLYTFYIKRKQKLLTLFFFFIIQFSYWSSDLGLAYFIQVNIFNNIVTIIFI